MHPLSYPHPALPLCHPPTFTLPQVLERVLLLLANLDTGPGADRADAMHGKADLLPKSTTALTKVTGRRAPRRGKPRRCVGGVFQAPDVAARAPRRLFVARPTNSADEAAASTLNCAAVPNRTLIRPRIALTAPHPPYLPSSKQPRPRRTPCFRPSSPT